MEKSSSEAILATTAVYAHRGSTSAVVRENTLDAFALAADLGADGVELDVRRTADGVLVVHHDAGVPGGRSLASSLRSDLPHWIPTLADALRVCLERGLEVNVEVKSEIDGPEHDPLERCGRESAELCASSGSGLGRLVVSSFSPAALIAVAEVSADLELACLLDVLAPLEGRAWDRGGFELVRLRGMHPFVAGVDASLVERAHDAGLAVRVWTVDDPRRISELASYGVDAVITNDVTAARRVLDTEGP